MPEDPTGDEEAVAALIARQLSAARALAAVALALQLLNVGIAGALGGAHVSALEAAAEGRAFRRCRRKARSCRGGARRGRGRTSTTSRAGARRGRRGCLSSPARGTFIPISSSSSSPERQPLLLPPSMQQQQQQQQHSSRRGATVAEGAY